jgi:hypothetical protein
VADSEFSLLKQRRFLPLFLTQSLGVFFADAGECRVGGGVWRDPYTGQTFSDPREIDIDHMVPLKNAHQSGGWAWDPDRRRQYANNLTYRWHLVAVSRAANRSKGDRSPDQWKPEDPAFWCLLDVYARGIEGGRTGMVTALQRAGGALNVNVHFHSLALDGMFTETPGGALVFRPAPGPSDIDVAAALTTIRQRVQRLLVRRGLAPGDDATGPADRRADESPVLAGIVGASVQGRVALGPRAGARVRRLGDARDAATVTSRGPRQAHLEGFDLHANVWVSANDRAGLERLCRYILRPPFAQERLRLRSDGRIARELKVAWHDGTRELVFEPLELLERLAAMTPRPETNLLICHGVLAPRARWRARVVTYGRPAPEPTASTAPLTGDPDGTGVKTASPRAWSWAALMHRAFGIDVLACAHCGGRLRLIATLHDPAVIRTILAHLALSHSGPSPGPGPPESGAVSP